MDTQPESTQQREKKELEKLLEELIDSGRTTSSTSTDATDEKVPAFLYKQEEKAGHFTFPFVALGLCIAFLAGVLLGLIFGFFWGKTHKQNSPLPSFEQRISRNLGSLEPNEANPTHMFQNPYLVKDPKAIDGRVLQSIEERLSHLSKEIEEIHNTIHLKTDSQEIIEFIDPPQSLAPNHLR